MATGAELTYATNAVAVANTVFGGGAKAAGASRCGQAASSAICSSGLLARGVAPSGSGVILWTGAVFSLAPSIGDPNRAVSTLAGRCAAGENAKLDAVAPVHMLFGPRQGVFPSGFATESFLPGKASARRKEATG